MTYLHSSTHPARWHPELQHTVTMLPQRTGVIKMTVTFLPPVWLLSFPGSVSLTSESIGCCLWLWHFQFHDSTGFYTSSHFLFLPAPLQGSAPTRGLGITEIPRGPIESFLLSIQRLHYAGPFAVTNRHHPTHNRHPTTTTYSDKNDQNGRLHDDMEPRGGWLRAGVA